MPSSTGNDIADLLENANKKKLNFQKVLLFSQYDLFSAFDGLEISWQKDTSVNPNKLTVNVIFHQMKFSKESSKTKLGLSEVHNDLQNLAKHLKDIKEFLEEKELVSKVEIDSHFVYWLANREVGESLPAIAKLTLKPIPTTWEKDLEEKQKKRKLNEEENDKFLDSMKPTVELAHTLFVQVHVVDQDSLRQMYGPFQEWFDVVSKLPTPNFS